jgi:hypothetical protein
MGEIKKLILYLFIGFAVINGVMWLSGQKDLFNYFIANSVAYLIGTILVTDLDSNSKLVLNMINIILLTTLVLIIIFKIYRIVT